MSGSLLTDFNDYHHKVGLKALHSLLLDAVAAFPKLQVVHDASAPASPHPFSASADQKEGVISRSEMMVEFDGHHFELEASAPENLPFDEEPLAESSEEVTFTTENILGRFALQATTTSVWDQQSNALYKKQAFNALVGKTLANEWFDNQKKRVIDQDAVKSALGAAAKKGAAGSLFDRFVMLEGTLESWDTERRCRVRNVTIKENFNAMYDIWIKSDHKRMIHNTDLVFNPKMQITEKQINMFSGMPITKLDNHSLEQLKAKCQGIYDLLYHICEQDDVIFAFTLKWLALPLQRPGTKLDSALLFHGFVQGAGKSLFFDKVMRKIYGMWSRKLGQGQMEMDYTDWKSQNLFTVFEEISAPHDRFSVMGKVKDMITADTARIEKKFVDGWEESTYINFVFLSNEIQPLPIDKDDRRFLVSWPKHKLPKDIQARAAAELDNDEAIAAWYSYLLKVDMAGFDEHTVPPMTEAKERIIAYGLPSWEVFYNEWRDGFLRVRYTSCFVDDLFTAYCAWCARKREKVISSNKFVSLVASKETEGTVDAEGNELIKSFRKGRCWYNITPMRMEQAQFFVVGTSAASRKQSEWLKECSDHFASDLHNNGGQGDAPDIL
jgi:putative DNA primase/helicase